MECIKFIKNKRYRFSKIEPFFPSRNPFAIPQARLILLNLFRNLVRGNNFIMEYFITMNDKIIIIVIKSTIKKKFYYKI